MALTWDPKRLLAYLPTIAPATTRGKDTNSQVNTMVTIMENGTVLMVP